MIALAIDGVNYSGFKDVAIMRGIEQAAWQFELTAAPQHQNDSRFLIEDGMACNITLGNQLALTGFVDDVNIDYDANNHQVQVTGRSAACDLVDCSTAGQQIKAGQSLLDLVKAAVAPFGLSVSVDASAAEAAAEPFATVDNAQDAGQPVWEYIEELARIRAVLIISNAQGGITITRTGTRFAHTALVLGKNILSCKAKRSHRSLFSDYTVAAQQPLLGGSAEDTSQSQANAKGFARRFRPQLIHADNPGDTAACSARADWQARVNYGRSQSIVYTVSDWFQDNGKLWQPNQLISITDPYNRLNNATMLITQTRHQLQASTGKTCQLSVMPPQAFELMAQVPQAAEGGF